MFNFNPIIDFVKASRPLQLVLVFIAGGVVAAVFYPTKQIKDTVAKMYQQQIVVIQQQNAKETESQKATFEKLSSEYSSYKTQTDAQISQLTTQVRNLKTHTKVTSVKVVHPDGTVEEHTVSENDTDQTEEINQQIKQEWQQKTDQAVQATTQQFQQQISTMQSQWASKEESYKQTISTMQETKTVTTNPKKFGVEAGLLTNSDYYGHITYDLWGPFFIGGHGELGSHPAGGVGLGLRF